MKADSLLSLKQARRDGKNDGREGLPDLTSPDPHSPFLGELASLGAQQIETISNLRSESFKKVEEKNSADIANLKATQIQLNQNQEDLKKLNEQLKEMEDEWQGATGESNSSRVSSKRYLGMGFYVAVVVLTGIGEIVITYPAFETLFQNSTGLAILSTIAASSMSIGFAHLLGITLKRSDDRKRRQPAWVLRSVLASIIIIFGLVLSLSNVRAQHFKEPAVSVSNQMEVGASTTDTSPPPIDNPTTVDGNADAPTVVDPLAETSANTFTFDPFSAPINKNDGLNYWAVFLLFIFLQFSLIIVAAIASYFHFSSLLEEKKDLLKELKVARAKESSANRTISLLESKINNFPEEMKRVNRLMMAEVRSLQNKVDARAQAYWGTNLRERADSPEARSRKFNSPTCSYPEWYKEFD